MRLFLLFIFCSLSIFQLSSQSSHEVKQSEWKGFERTDFTFEDKAAYIVFPEHALVGNPWVWRARFPGWHTEADSILISKGFHLVHINTAKQFGSPKAVKVWNDFYDFLLEKYELQQKVALMGVSRGGLFVYNWAKANPEKVSCIYAEAPVCDFTSWPGGFGIGKGSPKAWEILKKEYGFKSDDEARNYMDMPIHNLEAIARAKIPVLHMVGLEDLIVPPTENTFKLVDTYIKLGGIATVVPCTEGEQKLDGHHFPIETPELVADFILANNPVKHRIASKDYHEHKNGIHNAYVKFNKEKNGKVAFLGGSITHNGGWTDSIMAYLTDRFPETEFDFVNAGIPSMGTTPAAFRLERDILSQGKIDLLFEEAAVNDDTNGRSKTEQIRAMEGIVRHLRKENPAIDIVMMHFVDPGKMRKYRAGSEPAVIRNHNLVARQYAVPTINLAKEVTDRIDNNEFTWQDDFINLHPSPFGQGIYAHSMITFLENAFGMEYLDSKISEHILPAKLDMFSYDRGQLIDISEAQVKAGWKLENNWEPKDGKGRRANFHGVPMLTSEVAGSILTLEFKGTAVGIAAAAGPDAGIIEYRIDNGEWTKQDLFTRWSRGLHLPWYFTLAAELPDSNHILEIRTSEESNGKSNGTACRIRYFFAN